MKTLKYKTKIISYIKQNIRSDDLDTILEDNNFTEYAYFYNCYPYLFVEAFETIEQEKLEFLNIAGFLCYKAIVLSDDYKDKINPNNSDIKKVAISHIFLEQAKKILIELFSKDSTFWIYWQKRKLELEDRKSVV